MANVEAVGLGPRKSLFVLVIVVGCFAVLWPRILSPMFSGNGKEQMRPNSLDRSSGCCDMFVETDMHAIKIMTEVCGNILQNQGNLDSKTEQAFQAGKLTKDIIFMCRQEVNKTCGIDIISFLDNNFRLGKSYKQILDEIRSINGSNCLRLNYGVAPWSLGVPHLVGKFWMGVGSNNVRQERPPHLRPPPIHPALRERGRAIVAPTRAASPSRGQGPMEGRPMPMGGMRPPMGGAGGVVPPPKSTSVGVLMPLYTTCIVIFFLYTIFKMLFKRSGSADGPQAFEELKSDPTFRRKVFNEPGRSNRSSPESNKLGDEELDVLRRRLAETEYAMERIVQQMQGPLTGQERSPRPYTNGSVHTQREVPSLITNSKESFFKETTPPSWEASTPVNHKESPSIKEPSPAREVIPLPKEASPLREASPLPREATPPPKEATPPPKEATPVPREPTPPPKEATPPPKEASPTPESSPEKEVKVAVKEEVPPPAKTAPVASPAPAEEEEEEEYEYEEEEYEEEEEEEVEQKPVVEDEAIKHLRSSVEKEKATVKVLGMEVTAHAEGGRPWRPPASPVLPHPPRHPTPPVEVSSIYLEGALPHQSRLLVADSETHTEAIENGDDKDQPIVLSGKMTLSLITDESAKTTPDRDNAVIEEITNNEVDDEEFLTASAATAPAQAAQDEYDEDTEEEEEVEEEEVEVEEVEVEEIEEEEEEEEA